jgi:hypothetical protein
MHYDPLAAKTDWELLEVVRRGRRPCSDAYVEEANAKELANIFSELRLLQAAGCPPDRLRGAPEVEIVDRYVNGTLRIPVWVLKAKPSGWRLYFYVRDREQRIIEFLHAVRKKRWKRDPADFERCARILDGVVAGDTESDTLEIPPR